MIRRFQKDPRPVIDYVIHYVKAGAKTREKVFKLRELSLRGRSAARIEKRHVLRDTSGRRHYDGLHRLELQVNGNRGPGLDFVLRNAPAARQGRVPGQDSRTVQETRGGA